MLFKALLSIVEFFHALCSKKIAKRQTSIMMKNYVYHNTRVLVIILVIATWLRFRVHVNVLLRAVLYDPGDLVFMF